MDYLDQFSRFAAQADFARLPPEVQDQTRWILADTVGAIAAGSAEPELRLLAARRSDSGKATLIGLGRCAGAESAALLNGSAGTFLEMDEGNRFARGHPAIHVIPAALALSESRGADAALFLSAFVTGYEVACRIGTASRLRASMHPHGTWARWAPPPPARGLLASTVRACVSCSISLHR